MNESGAPSQNSGCSEHHSDYLRKAAEACAAGDLVLGMHLYLAAYEKALADPAVPDGMALTGLREAWRLACDLKERSMAEYVFEKLEPYLNGDEIASCAMKLQNLALDRLEQYGFSREELEDMAEMISQDFIGADGSVVKVESFAIPNVSKMAASELVEAHAEAAVPEADDRATTQAQRRVEPEADEPEAPTGKPDHVKMGTAPADGFNPYDAYEQNSIGTSYHAATNEGAGAHVFTRDKARAEAGERARAEQERQMREQPADSASADAHATPGKRSGAQVPPPGVPYGVTAVVAEQAQRAPRESDDQKAPQRARRSDVFDYQALVGFDEAVSVMRDFGVGLQGERGFQDFVAMLNEQHGLDRAPAMDTMLFRAPAIEDATRFVEATIGEIGLPVLRMSMEEGVQGVPMLCVTTQGNHRPRMNHAHNRFESPAILVIEDLDAWAMPTVPENAEGVSGFVMANISRGAREAVGLIRSAVEDPDVYVLVTASTLGEPDPFFYDVLEPMTVVDIGLPTESERASIWSEIAREHPSMRMIDRDDLVRFSDGLARYDIYMAAREAIEEAYKIGLVQRGYVPVSAHNIYEKIAACQPYDSDAYRLLEDEVIKSFRGDLEHLEDLLDDAAQ